MDPEVQGKWMNSTPGLGERDRRRAERRNVAPALKVGPRSVLILGAYRQALAVARSLKRAGLRVVLARPLGARSWLESSRDIDEVWSHPPISSAQFVDALHAFCHGPNPPDLIFPLGDNELALVALLAPMGLPVTPVAVTPHLLERCQEKEALLAEAAAVGVVTAPWVAVASVEALKSAATQIGYPLILKPGAAASADAQHSTGFFNGKARIIASQNELDALVERHAFPQGGALAQRMAQGPRHNVYFAAWNGQVRALAQTLALRTDRLDGTGLAVEGISIEPMPELVAQTRKLVARLEYTGAGCAQFLVDPRDGSSCFLEINARLGANVAAVIACGVDLPRLFVELMYADVPMQPASAVGRRFAWLGGDLAGLAEQWRAGKLDSKAKLSWIWGTVRAQLRAHSHITFQWRDPRPTLSLLWTRVRGALGVKVSPSAR